MDEQDNTQATTHYVPTELEQHPETPSAPPISDASPQSPPQSTQSMASVQSSPPAQSIQHPLQYMMQTNPPPAHPLQQQAGQLMPQPHSVQQPVVYPTAQPMEQMLPIQQQLPMPGYQVSITYPAPMQPMHGYQIPGAQPVGHPLPAGHHYTAQTHPMNTDSYPPNSQPQRRPASREPVIRSQPVLSLPSIFGDQPQMICCPNCKKTGKTRISYEIGSCAWIAFCLCFWTAALTLCSPCAFCIEQWQDVNHYCSHCNHPVGSYKR